MSPPGVALQELQQKRASYLTEAELEGLNQAWVGHRKPLRISPTNRSPSSLSNNNPISPTDVKTKNTGLYASTVCYSYVLL